MRIGVFLNNYTKEYGGSYTLSRDLVNALKRISSRHTFFFFYYGAVISDEKSQNSEFVQIKVSVFNRLGWMVLVLMRLIFHYLFNTPPTNFKKHLDKALQEKKIDLLWFPVPIYEKTTVPFVFTSYDLEHRMHPFFPEVSNGSMWEKREQLFATALRKAAYVITGTEAGKREINNFYQVPDERIKIIPYPTPEFALQKYPDNLNVESKFKIKNRYIFYPAQFWSHKNHISILLALDILLKKYNIKISAVFTGSDKGNMEYIKKRANELQLEDTIHFLGFVSHEVLAALYKNALALVYPTFFGPDNLPPLEAFALGCPVIASKLSGSLEQLGDAALLFDPLKEEDLSIAIKTIYEDDKLREKLIETGLKRKTKWTSENYVQEVISVFDEFELYRRRWE